MGSAVPVKVVIGGTDYVATLPHPSTVAISMACGCFLGPLRTNPLFSAAPGLPVRPANTGAAVAESGTVTFAAGQTYALLSAEATALVDAGLATLA